MESKPTYNYDESISNGKPENGCFLYVMIAILLYLLFESIKK